MTGVMDGGWSGHTRHHGLDGHREVGDLGCSVEALPCEKLQVGCWPPGPTGPSL